LILALHGCLQYHGQIGPAFVDDAGINSVGGYQQDYRALPPNHRDCGNQWRGMLGLVGLSQRPNYAQKSGPQMQALYSMMARAAGLNK